MNKYTTLRGGRRVCKGNLAEMRQLLQKGYTAGEAPTVTIELEAMEWVVERKAALGVVTEFYNVALRRRGIEAKTYNNYRNSLNASFNYLVKQKLLARNPCKHTELRKVELSPIHVPYTEAERQRITSEI